MKVIASWSRTDACGRYAGHYENVVLTQEEWDEKAKLLKVIAPYVYSQYQLGCGWSEIVYEMAMEERRGTGRLTMCNDGRGGVAEIYVNVTYLLEGHETPVSSSYHETMNEYNS